MDTIIRIIVSCVDWLHYIVYKVIPGLFENPYFMTFYCIVVIYHIINQIRKGEPI